MEDIPEQLVQLWTKYEEIAMHFNDLLIRLRTQAIAGVATIVTAAGFLTSRQSASLASEPWEAVAGVSILLLFAWGTIWMIDVCYYSRLLRGAVVALLEIEKLTKDRITFSHRVEQVVRRKAEVSVTQLEKRSGWQVKLFYFPIAVFLVIAVGVSVYEALDQK